MNEITKLEHKIRSVVDRVLWTCNASDDAKRILTEAIVEELSRPDATVQHRLIEDKTESGHKLINRHLRGLARP